MIAALLRAAAAGVLGAAAGFLGGLFGIGGGVIAIPLLGLIYQLDQQTAQGTALLMVVPNVLFGFWRYWRRFGLDLRIAGTLAITAMVATYPMARVATRLDPGALRLGFAAFLVGLAGIIAWRARSGDLRPPGRPPLAWGWTAVLGLVGGMISGLFGIGGAFIVPPVLTAFFGRRQAESQGLGLALVAPGTVIALATYTGAGRVDWPVGVPLAIGGLAAISSGVAAAHRLPERQLRLAFCGLLVVTAALLAWHG
jgi:uncharacterized membrane protein YfcA